MDCVGKKRPEEKLQKSSNTEKAAVKKSSMMLTESPIPAEDGAGINRIKLQQKRFKEGIKKKGKNPNQQLSKSGIESTGKDCLGDYEICDDGKGQVSESVLSGSTWRWLFLLWDLGRTKSPFNVPIRFLQRFFSPEKECFALIVED